MILVNVVNWVKRAGSNAALILMNVIFLFILHTVQSASPLWHILFISLNLRQLILSVWPSAAGHSRYRVTSTGCKLNCSPIVSSNSSSISFVLQQNHNQRVQYSENLLCVKWLQCIDSRWESVKLNNFLSLRKSISWFYIQVRFTPQLTSTSLIDFAEEAAVYCSHSESWTFWLISNIEN